MTDGPTGRHPTNDRPSRPRTTLPYLKDRPDQLVAVSTWDCPVLLQPVVPRPTGSPSSNGRPTVPYYPHPPTNWSCSRVADRPAPLPDRPRSRSTNWFPPHHGRRPYLVRLPVTDRPGRPTGSLSRPPAFCARRLAKSPPVVDGDQLVVFGAWSPVLFPKSFSFRRGRRPHRSADQVPHPRPSTNWSR